MIAHLIKFTVHPGRADELIAFLKWDAEVAAADEPGTLRFDAYGVPDDPDGVYLYEACENSEAFQAHCDAPPFKKFVSDVSPTLVAKMDVLLKSAEALASNVLSGR